MMTLHINTSGGTLLRRDFFTCQGACGMESSAILVRASASPWYGDECTCTNCGDAWSDGCLGERPFRPRWRQEAIARAVADWDNACACPVTRTWSADWDGYPLLCAHEAGAA